MRRMVFFEGIDKTGKTTLRRALADWRRDFFTYFDRGPWSRYALGRYYGYEGDKPALAVMRQAAPLAVVFHVHRDLDEIVELQLGAEGQTREVLEAQERLFDEAFATVPPAVLVHVHNRKGEDPAVLADEVRTRLMEIAAAAPSAVSPAPTPENH